MTPDVLAEKLWRAGLLRGITALALGVYVLLYPAAAPVIVRACAIYWIVDGLLTLSAGAFAAALALNRLVLVVRGGIAVAAGIAVVALPLSDVFAAWQPGHLVLLVSAATVVLAACALQLAAASLDALICAGLRRRLPGEWSFAVSAALSVALTLIAATTFLASPGLLAVSLGATAFAGGFGVLAAALGLRKRGGPPAAVRVRASSPGRAVRHLAVLVTLMGVLVGCASSSSGGWTKTGASPQDLARDDRDCLGQAQMVVAGPQGPRTEVRLDRYRRCMVDRGYAEAPVTR